MAKNYGGYYLEIDRENNHVTNKFTLKVMYGESVVYDCLFLYRTRKEAKRGGLEWLRGYLEEQLKEVVEALNNL